MSWHVSGSYLESCNCEAICPCRRIDGVMGGRSTYGVCLGALSWLVDDGAADGVELTGLGVVLATSYSDDEEGSPWSFVLYVDERGDDAQRAALEAIFTGPPARVADRPLPLGLEGEPAARGAAGGDRDRARSRRRLVPGRRAVEVRVAHPVPSDETVTCVIPGHERTGREVVAERLEVHDGELEFAFRGNCGYESDFDYRG